MLKLKTKDGRDIRLRPGVILGIAPASSEGGIVPGGSQLITTTGGIQGIEGTPEDVWLAIKHYEQLEESRQLERLRVAEEIKAEVELEGTVRRADIWESVGRVLIDALREVPRG